MLQKYEECKVSDRGLVLANCPQSELSLMYMDSTSVARTQATGICFLEGRILLDQLGKKMPVAGPNFMYLDLKYTWDKCNYSKVLVRRTIPFPAHAV